MGGIKLFEFAAGQPQEIFWVDAQNEYSFADIENFAFAQGGYFAGLPAGSICALSGFAPLELWVLILAAWSHGLAVLPFAEKATAATLSLALDQLPWTIHMQRAERAANADREAWPHIPVVIQKGSSSGVDSSIDVFIMTSGSTGTPKAIAHSLEGLSASARATLDVYGWQARDSWLLSLDPSHIGGLQILLRVWLGRGICYYGGEPKAVGDALAVRTCDFLSLVPAQIFRLLEDPRTAQSLRQAKAILLGGAATQESLLVSLRGLGLQISITYGSSETASQISAFKPGVFPDRPGHVGTILPGWELQSSLEHDLWIKGPAIMLGYWQYRCWHPTIKGRHQLADKGLVLGDNLYLEGRRDEIFQVGGENVAPGEILRCLEQSTCHSLSDMQILTKHDGTFGTVPWLVIRSRLRPEASVLNAAFAALPAIKRPREIWWFQSDEVSKLSKAHLEHLLSVEDDHMKRLWKYEKI